MNKIKCLSVRNAIAPPSLLSGPSTSWQHQPNLYIECCCTTQFTALPAVCLTKLQQGSAALAIMDRAHHTAVPKSWPRARQSSADCYLAEGNSLNCQAAASTMQTPPIIWQGACRGVQTLIVHMVNGLTCQAAVQTLNLCRHRPPLHSTPDGLPLVR